jgi:hypothetical protein
MGNFVTQHHGLPHRAVRSALDRRKTTAAKSTGRTRPLPFVNTRRSSASSILDAAPLGECAAGPPHLIRTTLPFYPSAEWPSLSSSKARRHIGAPCRRARARLLGYHRCGGARWPCTMRQGVAGEKPPLYGQRLKGTHLALFVCSGGQDIVQQHGKTGSIDKIRWM